MRSLFSWPGFFLFAPLVAFTGLVYHVADMFDAGEVLNGLALLLGAVAVLALYEGVLLRVWILPKWGLAISERVYAGNYSPDEDAVVALAEELRRSKDASRLPELVALVLADKRRLRGWRELADVQLYTLDRPKDALETMQKGADVVSGKEDRAMLLFRAAHLAEDKLSAPEEAQQLYAKAARKYPRTVYGRKAAEKVR